VLVRDPWERLLAQFEIEVDHHGWKRPFATWILQDLARLRAVGLDPTHTEMMYPEHWDVAWANYQKLLLNEPAGPLGNGLYALALLDWITYLEQITTQPQLLILKYEDWKQQPHYVLDQVTQFLKLDPFPHSSSASSSSVYTTNRTTSLVDADTRLQLQKFYQPFSQLLCSTAGWDPTTDCWPLEDY